MTVGRNLSFAVIGEPVDALLVSPLPFPTLFMLGAGQDDRVEAHLSLGPENILTPEGVAAVQG